MKRPTFPRLGARLRADLPGFDAKAHLKSDRPNVFGDIIVMGTAIFFLLGLVAMGLAGNLVKMEKGYDHQQRLNEARMIRR